MPAPVSHRTEKPHQDLGLEICLWVSAATDPIRVTPVLVSAS